MPYGATDFLLTDSNSDIFTGNLSGQVSAHIEHSSTWAYNITAQDASHAIASFIDWSGNLTVRVIADNPINVGPIWVWRRECPKRGRAR